MEPQRLQGFVGKPQRRSILIVHVDETIGIIWLFRMLRLIIELGPR